MWRPEREHKALYIHPRTDVPAQDLASLLSILVDNTLTQLRMVWSNDALSALSITRACPTRLVPSNLDPSIKVLE